ncbi:MAG: hypothetical protein KJS97_02465 [Alphaproteobacteria bacterium]|nr:hypothetical protein [Alphaproteobacteria bacterium]
MTDAIAVPLARAQTLAAGAATVAVVGAGLVALGALAGGSAPLVTALRTQEVTLDLKGMAAFASAIGVFTLLALPGLLLAGALLDLSKVLDDFGKGQVFTLTASAHLRKAGEGALWALAFKVVATPTIVSWITHEGRGVIWKIEAFDIGLIAFAAAIVVLGRVLEAAAQIKSDNDQIV